MKYNLMPLKYFVDVVQTRGFISAAKRNYVSETAVSSAIIKLEKDLQQKLINRHSGEFSLTPVGKLFYQRAVHILNSYNEIWHNLEIQPEKMIRIHFLEGMSEDAALFAQNMGSDIVKSFDEEIFNNSVIKLLNNEFDVLIGFKLAFINNAKIQYLPLRKIDFDLIFNKKDVEEYHQNLQKLAADSSLYLQYWQSTGISDIQKAMLQAYGKNDWNYKNILGVNSFAAACLNVNYRGGFAMVPETFDIPRNCNNIYRMTPEHLRNAFDIVVAFNKNLANPIKERIKQATSKSNQ